MVVVVLITGARGARRALAPPNDCLLLLPLVIIMIIIKLMNINNNDMDMNMNMIINMKLLIHNISAAMEI